MKVSANRRMRIGLLAVAGVVAASLTWVDARQGEVALDADDIGGVVTSTQGPEAGVWVVAETMDLETRFIRIVVTDDQGRYLVPDLPNATYEVFVRGYGLVDSARVTANPGQQLDLTAVVAPDGRAAATVYPANSWLSLMEIPSGEQSTEQVTGTIKAGCMICHQLGNKATREIPAVHGTFSTSLEAWDARVAVGPSAGGMVNTFGRLGPQRAAFATWTDRIAAGAFPEQAPPRPRGVERNLVVTLWDWGTPQTFTHTHAATDRRDPTVNPNGRIYGPDRTYDTIIWLDPITGETGAVEIPTRDVDMPRGRSVPSPYWGDQNIAGGPAAPRSGAMDQEGRVYVAATIRVAENQPDWCREGSSNKFAQYFPIQSSSKHIARYDPSTDRMTLIDTCFRVDHNEFGRDPDNPLYSGQRDLVGWVSMATYDETMNEQASQGWCPAVLDTNGDGTITKPWTEPDEPIDPTRDHRVGLSGYEVSVSPVDGSVWLSGIGGLTDNKLIRIERGSNPPETCKAELYTPPAGEQPPIRQAGGVKIDSQGVAWQNWRGSDHITSFDRSQCRTLNGPTAIGPHCPEGWTVYRKTDEPTFEGTPYQSGLNYLIMTDPYDTAGLGRDTVITFSDNADAMLALVPPNRDWVTLRVPYPMGFYTRQAHGRIDDPNGGWKGRGLWSTVMSYAVWHIEGGEGTMGGKGQKAKVAKFQFRPDPLAK